MKRTHRRHRGLLGLLLLGVLPFLAPGVAEAHEPPIEFSDARLKIEVNETAGDAGLQFFVDGEAWKSLKIFHPDGRVLIDLRTKGVLNGHGLTELFAESSEPPFNELPLEEFLQRFPEGEYPYKGTTIEGDRMRGTATLQHDIPAGPQILQPQEGGTVPEDQVVIEWQPVVTPGVEIVAYQVIVTQPEPAPKRLLQADLLGDVRRLPIAAEFLEPGNGYQVEVMALSTSGNQTFTEVGFTVS